MTRRTAACYDEKNGVEAAATSAQVRALFSGSVTGIFGGLTGVGGGVILVPLLTDLLKLPQQKAHGTSLAVIIFTAITAAIAYSLSGQVNWFMAAGLAVSSIAGAYFGARAMIRLGDIRLRQIFGAFVILIALRLLLFGSPSQRPLFDTGSMERMLLVVTIGLTGGLLSGLLGVGGGVIFVPAIVLVLGEPQHLAQGISLSVIVVTASVATIIHYRHGNVDLTLVPWLAPGAIIGGLVGARIANALPGGDLQRLYAGVLLYIGVIMLWSAVQRERRARKLRLQAAYLEQVKEQEGIDART